mmetsp:Transcript_49290/g.117275  ORF Transcript_49290/g.117275 Transcript_49290/m.117275 type:complete len:243 (-) Transcript_49290:1465-2193(-)
MCPGHGTHTRSPAKLLYVPAAHGVQKRPEPSSPGPHVHFVAAWLELVPEAHGVHAAPPIAALYFPAAHGEHKKPLDAPGVNPALHWHAVARGVEVEEESHAAHVRCGVWYSPAVHSAHADPGPGRTPYPALQMHAVTLRAPSSECPELAGHASHCAWFAVVGLYVADGHGTHGPQTRSLPEPSQKDGWENPAAHSHRSIEMDPGRETASAAHGLHATVPEMRVQYVSAGHCTHVGPEGRSTS